MMAGGWSPKSEVTVRPASRADLPIFLDLVDALADYEKLPRPEPDARDRLARDGFGETRRFNPYIGEVDGEVVGYAITFHTYSSFLARPTLYLEDVFVLPEARGRGLGRAFFHYLAKEALREGCGRMEWVVLTWNDLAIDFYERMGATRMSDWHTYRFTDEDLQRIAGVR